MFLLAKGQFLGITAFFARGSAWTSLPTSQLINNYVVTFSFIIKFDSMSYDHPLLHDFFFFSRICNCPSLSINI